MASVTINVDMSNAIKQRLSEINNPTTMLAIHNTLAKMCDPYVPFLNGPLSQTNVVTSKGVTYIQPYARRQYYGEDFNHTLDYHPLASAKWDKAMLRDHRQEFNEEVEAILKERMAEVDGR